jgi:hypothetical protein
MKFIVFLHHLHFFSVAVSDIENSFDSEWHIGGIVKLVLVRNFGIHKILVEHLILVLCHFSLLLIPDGFKVVYQLVVQSNWEFVEKRVLFYNFSHLHFFSELKTVFPQF